MNVKDLPSAERLSANSDFELKLVTIRLEGTANVPSGWPSGVRSSRKIGEVTPKLPSLFALFHTLCKLKSLGNSPLSLAMPQGTVTLVVTPGVVVGTATTVLPFAPPAHPGGKFSPTVTVSAVPS